MDYKQIGKRNGLSIQNTSAAFELSQNNFAMFKGKGHIEARLAVYVDGQMSEEYTAMCTADKDKSMQGNKDVIVQVQQSFMVRNISLVAVDQMFLEDAGVQFEHHQHQLPTLRLYLSTNNSTCPTLVKDTSWQLPSRVSVAGITHHVGVRVLKDGQVLHEDYTAHMRTDDTGHWCIRTPAALDQLVVKHVRLEQHVMQDMLVIHAFNSNTGSVAANAAGAGGSGSDRGGSSNKRQLAAAADSGRQHKRQCSGGNGAGSSNAAAVAAEGDGQPPALQELRQTETMLLDIIQAVNKNSMSRADKAQLQKLLSGTDAQIKQQEENLQALRKYRELLEKQMVQATQQANSETAHHKYLRDKLRVNRDMQKQFNANEYGRHGVPDATVELRASSYQPAGRGVFSNTAFSTGDAITQYEGIVATQEEFDALVEEQPRRKFYSVEFGSGSSRRWLVGTMQPQYGKGLGAFVNHYQNIANAPNVDFQATGYGNNTYRVYVRALRDIAAGEELVAEYPEEVYQQMLAAAAAAPMPKQEEDGDAEDFIDLCADD